MSSTSDYAGLTRLLSLNRPINTDLEFCQAAIKKTWKTALREFLRRRLSPQSYQHVRGWWRCRLYWPS
jgi:hypothetical protein